jgi:hypothetical protein
MCSGFIGGKFMYKPLNKETKEFLLIFSQLNSLNKKYARNILQTLHYAQEVSDNKNNCSDKKDKKNNIK